MPNHVDTLEPRVLMAGAGRVWVDLVPVAPVASEADGPDAVVVVERSAAGADPLTVALSTAGTAVVGTDCDPLPAQVTIPAGGTWTLVRVHARADAETDPGETVVLSAEPSDGYRVRSAGRSATVTLRDPTETVGQPATPTAVMAGPQSPTSPTPAPTPTPPRHPRQFQHRPRCRRPSRPRRPARRRG